MLRFKLKLIKLKPGFSNQSFDQFYIEVRQLEMKKLWLLKILRKVLEYEAMLEDQRLTEELEDDYMEIIDNEHQMSVYDDALIYNM